MATPRPYHQNDAEKIARYEAHVARVEATRADYVRRKPLYAKVFATMTAAGFACFAFGGFVGLWGSISATFVSLCGYAMLSIRISELAKERDDMRRDISRMRNDAE